MPETTWGIFFATLAALSWGTGAIFARRGMEHVGSGSGTLVSLIAGLGVTTIVALVFDPRPLVSVHPKDLAWLALFGVIQFPLGRLLNYTAIRLAGAAPATAILGSSPLISATWAIIFLGERLTLPIAVGITTVVAGLGLLLTERRA